VPAGASGQLREALVSGHGFTLFLSPFFGFAVCSLLALGIRTRTRHRALKLASLTTEHAAAAVFFSVTL